MRRLPSTGLKKISAWQAFHWERCQRLLGKDPQRLRATARGPTNTWGLAATSSSMQPIQLVGPQQSRALPSLLQQQPSLRLQARQIGELRVREPRKAWDQLLAPKSQAHGSRRRAWFPQPPRTPKLVCSGKRWSDRTQLVSNESTFLGPCLLPKRMIDKSCQFPTPFREKDSTRVSPSGLHHGSWAGVSSPLQQPHLG